MAEAEVPQADAAGAQKQIADEDADRPSVQVLREAPKLSDVRRANTPPDRHPLDSEMKIEIAEGAAAAGGKPRTSIETVYENTVMDKSVSSETAAKSSTSETLSSAEVNNVKQSLMSGRLNKIRDQCSSVFPVGTMGCKQNEELPSPRRFLDAGEASYDTIGHIENMPRKLSMRNNPGRNPVLGTGLGEEERANRADGAGESYSARTNANSSRVPPGGYSHGLW